MTAQHSLSSADLPPFPDDVPVARLSVLSLKKLLQSDDRDESERLFTACKTDGFFMLDLRDCELGEEVLGRVEEVEGLAERVFGLGGAEKECFRDGRGGICGYKAQGDTVVDDNNTPDLHEFYAISRDDILSLTNTFPLPTSTPHPNPITQNLPLLKSHTLALHTITTLLLAHLSIHLHLPPAILPSLHHPSTPSNSHLRLLKYPPQPLPTRRTSMLPHTDFGSITILFSRLGGLQILPPPPPGLPIAAAAATSTTKEEEWEYVRPLPGHAVVNIGDALVKFTNGLLRSCLHRVTFAPGEQAVLTRYSVAYFERPGDEVLLRGLEGSDVLPPMLKGEVLSSKEWIERKGRSIRRKV